VALSAVVGVPDARWGEVGHAFVEASAHAEVDEAAIRAWIDGRLARFKQPKVIHVGPLPRTASGKVDKVQLRSRT
jgi:fatty-acyl-CoA synthase